MMHVKIATGNAHDEGGIGGIGKQEKNAGQVEPFAEGTTAKESQQCQRQHGAQEDDVHTPHYCENVAAIFKIALDKGVIKDGWQSHVLGLDG